jgi:hypothetical protein
LFHKVGIIADHLAVGVQALAGREARLVDAGVIKLRGRPIPVVIEITVMVLAPKACRAAIEFIR